MCVILVILFLNLHTGFGTANTKAPFLIIAAERLLSKLCCSHLCDDLLHVVFCKLRLRSRQHRFPRVLWFPLQCHTWTECDAQQVAFLLNKVFNLKQM